LRGLGVEAGAQLLSQAPAQNGPRTSSPLVGGRKLERRHLYLAVVLVDRHHREEAAVDVSSAPRPPTSQSARR
jgi:hypothetical protein